MRLSELDLSDLRFRTSEGVLPELRTACESNPDLATFEVIGQSVEGRPLVGVTLGYGPHLVTLVAGAHADEPVGPETLRTLILESLAARDREAEAGGMAELFEQFTFRVVPHANPDGEVRNQPWVERWPDFDAYLLHRRREAPGADIEFGYPSMRPENEAISAFLFERGPVALHASLHGMGLSEGALLLLDEAWLTDARGDTLRQGFRDLAAAAGLRLHDHDRGGEKGFFYGGPGFTSTPSGLAMRAHFSALGDEATASLFHLSSMDLAAQTSRQQGASASPLCLVTELPLFVLDAEVERVPGVPTLLHAYQRLQPELLERVAAGESVAALVEPLGLRPLELATAVRIQLRTLDLALEAVGSDGAA